MHIYIPLQQFHICTCTLPLQQIAMWCKVREKEARKFPECLWRCFFYAITWIWLLSILCSSSDSYFFNLKSHYTGNYYVCVAWDSLAIMISVWKVTMNSYGFMYIFATGWLPTEPVGSSIYWLNMLEVGFYLHCLYAMVYLEPRRKDFVVMMLHHVLVIFALLTSYTFRLLGR